MQALEAQIQVECALRRLHRAKVSHQLRGAFRDERARVSELLGIRYAVVALVRRAEAGEFVCMRHPVELPAVDDRAAERRRMAVHVLGRRMRHNVRAPLDRAAVDRRCKRVVNDKRHAVSVRSLREALDVQNRERRVRDRLAEDGLRVRAERRFEFLFRAVRRDKRRFHAHFRHRDGNEVECAAVDAGRGDNVVAVRGDVEQRKKVCRLPGSRQHCRRSALERADLRCHHVAGRVLQARVEIPLSLEVKELSHGLAGVVFERGRLDDRNLARLARPRGIARLNAIGLDVVFYFAHDTFPFRRFCICYGKYGRISSIDENSASAPQRFSTSAGR